MADQGRAAGRRRAGSALVALMGTALLVAGCDAPGPSIAPSATPKVAAVSPSVSPWPRAMVSSVIALGAVDAEIKKGADDLARAGQAQDAKLLYAAAGGLARLASASLDSARALQAYPMTKDVGSTYTQAFLDMTKGATLLRTSLDNGDTMGISAGTKQLGLGLNAYAQARGAIADLVPEALAQERVYVK